MAQSSQTGRVKKSVLRHLSLPESVHEILRARILNNEIPAGTPLLEVALAEEFGVSRTTVRAAMRELQAERLIEITPRRGTTVIRMSEADAREVCFARFALEEIALKGLSRARRRDLADRMDDVLAVMDLCAAKGDLAGVVEADTDLHKVIVAASGHPLIVDMWTGLNGQMGALMRSSLDRQKIDLQATVQMHATLITAFREQPASTVVAALRDHYIGHPLEDS
ncbi:MAG TPA: GntR family transcriptional regulator [Pseudonocardiaceae bacterium]|nr:GntR family transcriptional regulator [Pseudonocardiaceae bacterium]